MLSISTSKGRLRKLVDSFKLKERLGKIIADSRNHYAERTNGGKKRSKRAKRARGPVKFLAYLVAFETRPFIGGSLVDNIILCCCYISLSLFEPPLGFSRLRVLWPGRASTELLSRFVSFALCVVFPGACLPGVEKIVVKTMLT